MLSEQYFPEVLSGTGFAHPQRLELERRGHTVTVITPHLQNATHYDHHVVEVPSLILPDSRGSNITLPGLGRVDSILKKADIIQAYESLTLGKWAVKRASELRIPSVYFHHPLMELTNSNRSIINQFQAVITPLPSDIESLRLGGITAPILSVVYGHNFDKANTPDPHWLQRQLDLNLDTPVVLYAGPLTSKDNCLLLIDTSLSIQYPHHLVLMGEGPARHELEQYIYNKGAVRSVHLLPSDMRDKTGSLFGSATLALSHGGDSHPTWLVEAANYGLPIVAVRGPETEHVVLNRTTGILTLPTKTALSQAVTQLLHRPGLAHRYGQNAKTHAASFSLERSVDQLLNIYSLVRRTHRVEA